MRCNFYKFDADGCDTIAFMQNPYFNRTLEHFCSHAHTPNNPAERFAGAFINGNVAYIGWDIFSAYAKHGHICFKEIFTELVNRMLGDELTVKVDIPDRAVVTYTRQETEKRNILHLLFAHTTVRGTGTEVIEDTIPLFNVNCSVKCDKKPTSITAVPGNIQLDFKYTDGYAEFIVPKVDIHQMIEIKD